MHDYMNLTKLKVLQRFWKKLRKLQIYLQCKCLHLYCIRSVVFLTTFEMHRCTINLVLNDSIDVKYTAIDVNICSVDHSFILELASSKQRKKQPLRFLCKEKIQNSPQTKKLREQSCRNIVLFAQILTKTLHVHHISKANCILYNENFP